MKTPKLLSNIFAITVSFFIAQSSSAYLQYTYESDALDWQFTKLNDFDFDGGEINNDPDGNLIFRFSVNIDEAQLSSTTPTSFIVKDANVFTDLAFGGEYYDPSFHSLFYGKITINPDRTIKFWNFITTVEVSDLNEGNYLNKLRDHDVRIISAGGATTCDCDRYWEDLNITTQRPYNTWIIAAKLDNHYSVDSDWNNWTVTEISVAEPGSLALMIFGLTGCLLLRRKHKLSQEI